MLKYDLISNGALHYLKDSGYLKTFDICMIILCMKHFKTHMYVYCLNVNICSSFIMIMFIIIMISSHLRKGDVALAY